MKLLLLFDIDGTLLDSGGLGLRALRVGLIRAFSLSLQEEELPRPDLAGATDAGVMRELFAGTGVEDTPRNRERFLRAYLEVLAELFRDAQAGVIRALPGVKELLEALNGDPDFVLGLLTGNAPEGASLKLSQVGLEEYFSFGAFGTDRENRNELGWIALERAERLGHRFQASEVLIIGDTPRDIACAEALGASCLAVATGSFSQEALRGHGAHHVFPDLRETGKILSCLQELRRLRMDASG